jgi:hypothetical protein
MAQAMGELIELAATGGAACSRGSEYGSVYSSHESRIT